jgi:hypothetical protein
LSVARKLLAVRSTAYASSRALPPSNRWVICGPRLIGNPSTRLYAPALATWILPELVSRRGSSRRHQASSPPATSSTLIWSPSRV